MDNVKPFSISTLQVEVAYATANKQIIKTIALPNGATIADAISAAKLHAEFPELNLSSLTVGIFSRKVALDTQIHAGDRIEIYHPLNIDPKQARRMRLKNKK